LLELGIESAPIATDSHGLFAFGMNRSHSASHSGVSTYRNGIQRWLLSVQLQSQTWPALLSIIRIHIPERESGAKEMCQNGEGAWTPGKKNAGLGAQVDRIDPLVDGEYIGREYGPTDNEDAN
jgi:hypothetical protein